MRVLKSATFVLGLLLAGTALTSTLQSMRHVHTAWGTRISAADPIPICPYRKCNIGQ